MERGTARTIALATAAAAALATAAGCGDDGEGKEEQAKAPTTPTIPVEPNMPPATGDDPLLPLDAPAKSKKPKKKRKAKPRGGATPVSGGPPPPPPSSSDQGLAVRRVVSDTLAEVGYTGAKVSVSFGGRVVEIGVRASQACSRARPTSERLTARIRDGSPQVRTVRVTVSGTGQSISAYRRTRCDAPSPAPTPTPARGRGVVYTKTGSGPFTTPAFLISARTWSVTYRNDGDFFQASILKDGRAQPFVLSSTQPGTRTETLRGPGRFQVKVSAGDSWSISVRDGT